jgi:phosphohistidine phosphatase
MIVGHLPFLSRLASTLLIGDETVALVAFRNGGVVCLERGEEKGRWRLTWAVVPELLGAR